MPAKMPEEIVIPVDASKEEKYKSLLPQIKELLRDEDDLVANLANVSAALKTTFGFFWIGFYLVKDNELVLGPFQGPLACTRIALDQGVCGAAASQKKTITVPDVDKFPGHITCSAEARSEIVVPLVTDNRATLVLDIDSDQVDDFDGVDEKYLQEIVALLGSTNSI